MNTSKILVVAASCVFLAAQASAVTLFGIISGPTVSASSAVGVDPSVTVASSSGSVYQRGSGLIANSGGTFNSESFLTTSQAAAIAAGDFITWSFSSAAGVDLTSFNIRYDRSNSGPTSLVIQLDAGSGFTTVHTDTSINASGEDNLGIDLSAFDNVTSGTFRLVAWGGSTGGTFDFENSAPIGVIGSQNVSFVLEGEPVPEPATMTVLAAAGLLAARRRKSR
jgi:hypothetical protein